jgi:hypothetical protein
MGAAWREPKDRDLDKVCEMVAGVKAAGLETCATLGMLTGEQARRLKAAGLDYYNHNLDTSPDYYGAIITTRTYEERLHTLDRVRAAGIHVCCGGIVGMGESAEDRVGMIADARDAARASRKRADQHAGQGRGHAAGPGRDARSDRFRAHHRGCPHHHAEVGGAAVGRSRGHERGDPGAVLPRRRQFHLLRAEAAHHGQSRPRPRLRLLDKLGLVPMA